MSLSSPISWIIGKALDKKSGLSETYYHSKVDLLLKKKKDLIQYQRQRKESPWVLEILEHYPEKSKEVALNLIEHVTWPNCAAHREQMWSLIFKNLSTQEDWETLKVSFEHFKTNYYELTGQVTLRKTWDEMSKTLSVASLLKVCELSTILYEDETSQALWLTKQLEHFFDSVLNHPGENIKEAEKLAEGYKEYWTHLKHWPNASKVVIFALHANPPPSNLTLVQKVLCSGLVSAMRENVQHQYENMPTFHLSQWNVLPSKLEEIKAKKIEYINMAYYTEMDPVLSLCGPELLFKEQLSEGLPQSLVSLKSKRI